MADRPISELPEATTVTDEDMLVLQQNNRAKQLTGRVFRLWALEKMRDHGGISGIAKTSTSGLADTYTITFADESTSQFVVTNGMGIASITKTVDQQDPLKDIYTITYNDSALNPTTYTFYVENGRGIDTITKSSDLQNPLRDVYTIDFNDNTNYVFNVDNGRGISSIQLYSTSGLEDTYRILYNNNTYSEFTVTNGEKGDQGNQTYVWIRYSAQRPVQDADMKTEPDNWIGLYVGLSNTAPSTYSSYQWYQYKGEKGDTGDSVTVGSVITQYQKSESNTIVPITWLDEIPAVPSGWYLWTKVSISFNPSGNCTYYTAVRSGVDGTGSVSSVCDVAPDAGGNVDLMHIVGTRLVIA